MSVHVDGQQRLYEHVDWHTDLMHFEVLDETVERDQSSRAYGGDSHKDDAHPPTEYVSETLGKPLPPAPDYARELSFTRHDLRTLRRFILSEARDTSMCETRAEDLVLAVNELATNSVRYGGGHGTARIWSEDDTLLCEVLDSGHIRDPSVGRVCPTPNQQAGRGLWLVNRLCDLVQIHSSAAGSVVRVQMRVA